MAKPFHRSDARVKVAGRAIYGVDLGALRMLVGGLVRSRTPRGKITRLDVSAARDMPGVTVVTAADLPVPRYGMVVNDQTPLASTHVRFAAEPIVAVAAPDLATLATALDAVEVETEPEPGVFDLEAAAQPDSALVHPAYESYSTNWPVHREGNVCGRSVIETGAVDDAFAAASVVVEGRYVTPRVHQGYLEPRSCLATVLPDSSYQVETSTQNPFGVRGTLSTVLGIPESRVRVVASTVGGGFGGKLDVTLEHFACLLARKSGRPVKMMSSRAEELSAANPRENSVVTIRSGLNSDGHIITREVVCLLDAGAYAHDTPFIGSIATMQATGPYRIDNVRSTALSVYTNTQPTGAYRGPSGPQMVLAVEAHMDEIARQLGQHPLQLRRRHFFQPGDVALNGQVITDPSIAECLDRVLETIDYDADRPDGHSVGIACAWWTTTAGPAAATARLEVDGTVSLMTGGTEIGSGALATGVVHLAARHLTVAPERVQLVSTGDTGSGAFDFGAQGSRTTFNIGNAVLQACESIRHQLLDEAAQLLEADVADLDLIDGTVRVRGVPKSMAQLDAVARSALNRSGPIHASARYVAPPTEYNVSCVGPHHFYPTFNSPSFHCHAAEVAVDAETGRVRILRYVVAQDMGNALVPPAVEGQIHGGVLQGIGLALYEEEILHNGSISNASFDDYALPTAMEAPHTECILVERPSQDGPHGAKGVGEPPIILPGAAIASAVSRATGRPVCALPLTPPQVLDHIARTALACPSAAPVGGP
jgi:CO/xanthine dehydrogenase Mo-binding subunit